MLYGVTPFCIWPVVARVINFEQDAIYFATTIYLKSKRSKKCLQKSETSSITRTLIFKHKTSVQLWNSWDINSIFVTMANLEHKSIMRSIYFLSAMCCHICYQSHCYVLVLLKHLLPYLCHSQASLMLPYSYEARRQVCLLYF